MDRAACGHSEPFDYSPGSLGPWTTTWSDLAGKSGNSRRLYYCPECGSDKGTMSFPPLPETGRLPYSPAEFQVMQSDSYGVDYAKPNLGLNAVPKNRGEWKKIAKEKGLTHAG